MKLITWNIQWGRGGDGRVDIGRTAAELRATADADVICLQEVAVHFPGLAGSAGEDQIKQLARHFPHHQSFFGIATDVPCEQGGRSLFGNLLLSRLPVLQVFRHLLPWPVDPGVPSMQRVAIEAVVQSPSGPLRVITTHLEYYSAHQRIAQAQALRQICAEGHAHGSLASARSEENPVFAPLPRGRSAIVCGDFNCRAEEPAHALMTSPFADETPQLVDAWEAAHPDHPHAYTVGLHGADWPDEPYCCDFVFVSQELVPRLSRVEVNQRTAASDHQPVLVELADA